MTDTPLHSLTLGFNSKPRDDVQGAVQGAHKVNSELASKHIIQESPSTQANIQQAVFDKLTTSNIITKIAHYRNTITEKAATSSYLGSLYVLKTAEMQGLIKQLNGLVTSRDNDKIISDLIGG